MSTPQNTTFVNGTTIIQDTWMNGVNDWVYGWYGVMGEVFTATAFKTSMSAASSGANSDITSLTGLTTPLSIAQGGTGAATHTANNVLIGAGTSAVTSVAPGTSGNLLTSNGTTWVSQTPTTSSSTLGTPVASTSGSQVLFSSLPAGIKRITITLSGVSWSGTDELILLIGDAGGLEGSGYLNAATYLTNAGSVVITNNTSSFVVTANSPAAASVVHGSITLTLLDSTTFLWACESQLARSDAAFMYFSAGSKALSAELTQLAIDTSGTNTFDAGAINILYE